MTVNSPGNPRSKYLSRRKEGLQWEGFAEKEGFSLERKSDWVSYRDGIPALRRSPIQVLTGPDVR